jgi:hypothetical protein
MSVELRLDRDTVVCDWGRITNPDGNPAQGIQPLMLVTGDTVTDLLDNGPHVDRYGNRNSARALRGDFIKSLVDGLFFDSERGGQRWTWKLFIAHWWDDPTWKETAPLFVGRWMD